MISFSNCKDFILKVVTDIILLVAKVSFHKLPKIIPLLNTNLSSQFGPYHVKLLKERTLEKRTSRVHGLIKVGCQLYLRVLWGVNSRELVFLGRFTNIPSRELCHYNLCGRKVIIFSSSQAFSLIKPKLVPQTHLAILEIQQLRRTWSYFTGFYRNCYLGSPYLAFSELRFNFLNRF